MLGRWARRYSTQCLPLQSRKKIVDSWTTNTSDSDATLRFSILNG